MLFQLEIAALPMCVWGGSGMGGVCMYVCTPVIGQRLMFHAFLYRSPLYLWRQSLIRNLDLSGWPVNVRDPLVSDPPALG